MRPSCLGTSFRLWTKPKSCLNTGYQPYPIQIAEDLVLPGCQVPVHKVERLQVAHAAGHLAAQVEERAQAEGGPRFGLS